MIYKKFKSNDLFYNTLEMHPQFNFVIYDGSIYLNNRGQNVGAHVTNALDIPTGHVSLYELNVDRPAGERIYPFISKNGSLSNFKTISTSSFWEDYEYGDTLTGSYPMSASIVREFFATTTTSRTASANHINSLYNTFNFYTPMSRHYAFSSSLGNKGTQNLNLISIPSILFGAQIEQGSVDLQFYVSGTLIGQLKDQNRNGELIQVGPSGSTGSGSVAGVVLYNEGFIALTGSWDIGDGFPGEAYVGGGAVVPRWIYFGKGANDNTAAGSIISSSFGLTFKGTTKTQTITMLAHTLKGDQNHSNNPTYIKHGQSYGPYTASTGYSENSDLEIKNIVSSSYSDPYADFKKTTYISSVAIYDENRNLIGIAKLATPVKKTEDIEYTFKMKLDI